MQLADFLSRNEITQTDFAESIGVSKVMVSCLVRGTKTPSGLLARKIELVTGGAVTLSDWFPDVDLPTIPSIIDPASESTGDREVARG